MIYDRNALKNFNRVLLKILS